MKKIPVGILGATGIIGQHYLALLHNHPWFEPHFLSSTSVDQPYEQVVANKWVLDTPPPSGYTLGSIDNIPSTCRLLFSALPTSLAKKYEPVLAQNGHYIISSASTHRLEPDIPLIIPEVNADHLAIIPHQQTQRGWKGWIVCKPNCSIQSYMIPLTPLHKAFTVTKIHVTTLQAISGAGRDQLSSEKIDANVIPFIAQEEEKSQTEPLKIWGTLSSTHIEPNTHLTISAQCNRVCVPHGHLACLSFALKERVTHQDILDMWKHFEGKTSLPSTPTPLICYHEDPSFPQPKLHTHFDAGMTIACGRLRSCPLLDFRMIALSHNAIRGGAGGGILIAEQLKQEGYLG